MCFITSLDREWLCVRNCTDLNNQEIRRTFCGLLMFFVTWFGCWINVIHVDENELFVIARIFLFCFELFRWTATLFINTILIHITHDSTYLSFPHFKIHTHIYMFLRKKNNFKRFLFILLFFLEGGGNLLLSKLEPLNNQFIPYPNQNLKILKTQSEPDEKTFVDRNPF